MIGERHDKDDEVTRYPMEEIESALEVAGMAAELVTLWESPNINGLPRAERNAAIEDTREKLIAAVHWWQDAKDAPSQDRQ